MPNPSTTLQNEEYALQNIIQALVDGQEGFKTIGESIKDEGLRTFFLAESLEHARFRGDLESVLHQEGVRDVASRGTANGTLLRAWGGLKSKLGGGDTALLSTADEASRDTLEAYRNALQYELPLPVRQMIVSQSTHIEVVRGQVQDALRARN